MSKSVSKFALAASFVLAMAFTFSCSGDDGGNSNIGTCGGNEYDTTVYSCEKGELVGSCRGNSYYPKYQYCDNNGEIKEGAEISSSSLRNSSSSRGGSPSSSSVGTQGGINLSALSNKQVYLVEFEEERIDHDNYSEINHYPVKTGNSNDNGYVVYRPREYSRDGDGSMDTPVGKIQNGILFLDSLPSISRYSEFLREFTFHCKDFNPATNEDYSSCVTTISSYPSNLSFFGNDDRTQLKAIIPGKNCSVELYMWNELSIVGLMYFSKSASIKGTETYTFIPYHGGDTGAIEYDLNISEGWNLIYWIKEEHKATTSLPALEWGLICE